MRTFTAWAALLACAAVLSGCGLVGRNQETQQQDVTQRLTRLTLDLDSGDITLRASGDDKVRITRRLHWTTTKPGYTEEWSGDALRVTAKDRCNCSVDYEISLPAGTPVEARTDSGEVTVTDLTGDLRLSTDSGDITATNPRSALWAHSDSGRITATGAQSAKAELSADSGDIRADFTQAPTSLITRADSGTITVTVPRDPASYQVEATASSGEVRVDVTREPGSPRTIKATSDSGDVTVRYA
ncbi:hypothetical protein JOF53_001358 [Crossiella equi]|uniref:DUF4097 domain-containing protein n=1 Tax=Crossiella equi TaxID=130796 RepID=A0ABS5A7A7_9PSEU|nr:DUF4097 family beta strand repeat-containing protein [Crossiella equi]MBP2472486.1 hypothetical protein [Crossiella equi]